MDMDKLKAVLESMLFVSEVPLSAKKAASVLKDVPPVDIAAAFEALKQDIDSLGRSFQVKEVAEGYLLTTRPEFHRWAREVNKVVTITRLSRQAMEALAIIAYKQPVTRAEVEAIRGVAADNMMRFLLDKGFIKEVGKKDAPGKPIQYGTTKEFLKFFRLGSIADLPKLDELERDRFELEDKE